MNAIKSNPTLKTPNVEQENIMLKIRDNSGISIVQDKDMAKIALGHKHLSANGVFVSKEINPLFQRDVIIINTNANTALWYSVLFHELAHASGTSTRLNRVGIVSQKDDSFEYSYEEILAESVARRLMNRLGLATSDSIERSYKYINHYSMKMETPVSSQKLALEIEAAENMVMEWLQGIEFKAA